MKFSLHGHWPVATSHCTSNEPYWSQLQARRIVVSTSVVNDQRANRTDLSIRMEKIHNDLVNNDHNAVLWHPVCRNIVPCEPNTRYCKHQLDRIDTFHNLIDERVESIHLRREVFTFYRGPNSNSNNHFHIGHIVDLEHSICMGIGLFVGCIETTIDHCGVAFLSDDSYMLQRETINERLFEQWADRSTHRDIWYLARHRPNGPVNIFHSRHRTYSSYIVNSGQ